MAGGRRARRLRSGLVRIPSGDLAPARRRGGRSSYVRRRPRWPYALTALALAAAAGGVYTLTTQDGAAPGRLAQAVPSPSCSAQATTSPVVRAPAPLPSPGDVVFALLNGTDRSGLGKTVGDELATRSLTTTTFANAPAPVQGDTLVTFGPGQRPGAQVLAANILGVRLVPEPASTGITVSLGSNYTRLTTPSEVQAYVAALAAPVRASTAPSCR